MHRTGGLSDFRLTDHRMIGLSAHRLQGKQTNGLKLGLQLVVRKSVSQVIRCIVKCEPKETMLTWPESRDRTWSVQTQCFNFVKQLNEAGQ